MEQTRHNAQSPISRFIKHSFSRLSLAIVLGACAPLLLYCDCARAQQTSVSTWEAADFRIWGFVPYWSGQAGSSVVAQLNILSTTKTYDHVSDVLYFGGVRPTPTGGLWYHSTATQTLTTLQNHAAQHGFRLHMSMFDVAPGATVDATWTSLVSNPAYRAAFVANVTSLLETYDMSGFNFDWERPRDWDRPPGTPENNAIAIGLWGNYTQLARELGNVIRPLGMEISVDDYGFADSRWDDSPLFDARVYDQLFIMGYHYPAFSGNSLNYNNFANGKLALDDQGAEKAFKNQQLAIGVGTWGAGGPATVRLRNFAEANPALGYNVSSITGTYVDVNGTTRTGTWNIESRQQVREKTQLALDRGMPGMFTWTLHYDATNNLGLHRVMHHYMVFQRSLPDLNLDGLVNATDANQLANEMGTVPGWTGTNTPARFDDFYLSGNWEKGDRDGNGFVNQQDADWLAGRFAALDVALPDRLAYTGSFERFQDGRGLSGRWQAVRNGLGQLPEAGNFTQHDAGFLSFSGSGPGASLHSNSAVTLRNQNAAEAFDSLNMAPRMMRVELVEPIDLAQNEDTYVTFLIRQNTAPLLAAQVASPNRTLALEFLDAAGQNQFQFAFHAQQQQFAIENQADAAGDDVAAGGFAPDTTYLFVGKIAGNGSGPSTLQASLFANGSIVGRFIDPGFAWMLTASGGAGFDPVITQLQLTSLFEANYAVSNVWIGSAGEFFTPLPADFGDFNADGTVDAADYVVWHKTGGTQNDYDVWRANFGRTAGSSSSQISAVPEPTAATLGYILSLTILARRRVINPVGE